MKSKAANILAIVSIVLLAGCTQTDNQGVVSDHGAPSRTGAGADFDRSGGGQGGQMDGSSTQSSVMAGPVNEVTDATFEREVVEAQTPVLVDFYADWCGPCKRMEPILSELAQKYEGKIKVVRVNTDRNPDLVNQYSVNAIPRFMVFKGGQMVEGITGATTRQRLAETLEKTM